MKVFFIRRGGEQVKVTEAEYLAAKRAATTPKPRPGLGDAIATIATPIARALGLSCIDPATQQLRPESPCARRKATLNRIIPPSP